MGMPQDPGQAGQPGQPFRLVHRGGELVALRGSQVIARLDRKTGTWQQLAADCFVATVG